MIAYQLCTYDRDDEVRDPLLPRYTARYRRGILSLPGSNWDERFASLLSALGDLPCDGWYKTVGNPELCEFYSPDPPPFGCRVVLRFADPSA